MNNKFFFTNHITANTTFTIDNSAKTLAKCAS